MRNLIEVIDQITEVAPDLKELFTPLRLTCQYTAPELLGHRWDQAGLLLNKHALDHPKKKEIFEIFSGEELQL